MRISFDLDGVIAETHHWFFGLLNITRGLDRKLSKSAEMDYYNSLALKIHPRQLMDRHDTGVIITSRKPWAQAITNLWLARHGIDLPVFFADPADQLDWAEYNKASAQAAELKARIMLNEGVEVHFDNNPVLIRHLREFHPDIKAILIGGAAII